MKPILPAVVASLAFLAGCGPQQRLPPPPSNFSSAAPVGFTPQVRMSTTDRKRYLADSSRFFGEVRRSATDGSLDVLTLSGGGSGGAFGAGVLVGLTQASARPRYELVAGVSVGSLVAPYAFLGPEWDSKLIDVFSSETPVLRNPGLSSLLMAFVRGPSAHGEHPLEPIVDRIVTPDLIAAVAKESRAGRHLIVATTDLDRQETTLWDMGAIARTGGEPARMLFRSVLLASASVPGIFPPVLFRVQEGMQQYDELHADGGITTSLFAGPLVARLVTGRIPELADANVYVIANGQMAVRPSSTPLETTAILQRTYSAASTYKLRQDVAGFIELARSSAMELHVAEIPASYPVGDFLDFTPKVMKTLFDFGRTCAAKGRVWLTPEQSIQVNLEASAAGASTPTDTHCPGDGIAPHPPR